MSSTPHPMATRLRVARIKSGLTQRELGELAGVTQSVICAFENGSRPLLTTVERLATPLGMILVLIRARES